MPNGQRLLSDRHVRLLSRSGLAIILSVPMLIGGVTAHATSAKPAITATVGGGQTPPGQIAEGKAVTRVGHPFTHLTPRLRSLDSPPDASTGAAQFVPPNPPKTASQISSAFALLGKGSFAPPDTDIGVGPNHILELVNSEGVFVNKSDHIAGTPFDMNTFFGLTPPTSLFSDPWVAYDPTTDRWYFSAVGAFNGGQSGSVFLAVSKVGDAGTLDPALTSRAGWNVFTIYNQANLLCDQPKLAFSSDKILVSCTEFSGSTAQDQQLLVVSKNFAITPTPDQTIPESDLTSPELTLIPVTNDDYSSGHLALGTDIYAATQFYPTSNTSAVRVDRVIGTAGSGAQLVRVGDVPTQVSDQPVSAVQPGSSTKIDTGDARIISAALAGNTLWTGSNAACVSPVDQTIRTCIHIVRADLGNLSASFDKFYGAPGYAYYPAIALDSAGDALVTYTYSSANLYPSMFEFDVLMGGTQSDSGAVVKLGSEPYWDGFNSPTSPSRWGDYSGAATDPANPAHVYLAAEYAPAGAANGQWATEGIGMAVAPSVSTISPNTSPAGSQTNVLIGGRNFQAGATVTFGGVSGTSPVVNSSTSISVTTPSGNPGTVAVVVTNPDGTQSPTTGPQFTYQPLADTFYFAEGFTGVGFQTNLSLFMPTHSGIAQVNYSLVGGGQIQEAVPMGAGQVATVDVNQAVGSTQQVSAVVTLPFPGVVERTMHFQFGNWHGSTDVVGVTSPADEWDFAEGSTLGVFSEYLTLQNPNPQSTATILSYFNDNGTHPTKTITLPANSRTTVEVFNGNTSDVSGCIPAGPGANCGVGSGIQGVSVRVTSVAPIVAERPMYVNNFSFGSGPIADGHDVFGANAAATTWSFAEGTTLDGFNEYLTLQNPGTANALVVLDYITNLGSVIVHHVVVPGLSRSTIMVSDPNSGVGPGYAGVSVQILSDQPIVAERPMYMVHDFGSGTVAGATVVMGATSTGTSFEFASASTSLGENDFLTIQNQNQQPAIVTLTYYTNSGAVVSRAIHVDPNTRHTVQVWDNTEGVGAVVAVTGVVVTSDQPILVEKPTYNSTISSYGATDTLGYELRGAL